jgi:hypothetical protein
MPDRPAGKEGSTMAKHERPDDQPESRPIGNTDPSKRGRGGRNPNIGQPGKGGKHEKTDK